MIAKEFLFRQKRAGHLISKMRFISAQLEAYLQNGLWLRNAQHANDMAQRLYKGLIENPKIHILHPVQANEVFLSMPNNMVSPLRNAGAAFYDWPHEEKRHIRLVTSFNTQPEDVEQFLTITNT